MIIWYLVGIFLVLFLSCEYYTAFKTHVPTVASFPSARKKIIEILKGDFEARPLVRPYKILDLGSGSGQLCRQIAQAMPQAQITGVEISYVPWLRSVIWQKLFGPSNLEYKRVDFWSYDCSKFSAVVTFLTENIMEQVGQKLRKELPPEAIVVANDVPLQANWKPVDKQPTGFMKFEVFIYRQ